MINGVYLGYNESVVFGTIVEEKNKPGKQVLRNISPRVLAAYEQYLNQFPLMVSVDESAILETETSEKKSLRSCYSGETDTLKYIRGKIFQVQPDVLKGICPYCLLGDPRTLDHYIGQGAFPEYSVLLKNLIPCCSTCNHAKGEVWRHGGRRRIIHFYLDTFLHHNFLKVDLTYNPGIRIPKASFSLQQPVGMNDVDFDITHSHFEDLGLINTYNSRVIPLISSEHYILHNNAPMGTTNSDINSAKKALEERAKAKAVVFGVNYYESVIYQALSESNRFLTNN